LCLVAVAACAAYAAVILSGATLADIQALDAIAAEHEHWHVRPVTATELQTLRTVLWAAAGFCGLIGTAVLVLAAGRQGLQMLRLQTQKLLETGRRYAKRFPRRALASAALALCCLTALRLYFSLTKPVHPEEIASYEYFVRPGLLAVSAYYPIPNNHILSNAINWVFYQIHPHFWWSMRLPVLLAATAGTVALAAGLLRWTSFRVATGATAAFSCLQLCLYNASAGRGYWLLILLAGLLFFCTLELARTDSRAWQPLAWAGLLMAGLAGCYTVPTFAYALGAALSWLAWYYVRRRKLSHMVALVAVSSALALGLLALYSPVLLVSGSRLFGNGFVSARKADIFWPGLPSYLLFTEGMLVGQRTLGGLLALMVFGCWAYWLLRRRPRRNALGNAALARRALIATAWWFGVFPYLLLVLQRVFAPERVLLYKAFFFFVLLALGLEAFFRRLRRRTVRRWSKCLLVGVFSLYVAYEASYVEKLNRYNQQQVAAYRAGFDWLATQPAGPVLAPEPLHDMYFRFFAHARLTAHPWQLHMVARPGLTYAYVVAFPNRRGAFQPAYPFPPAFANEQVEIFVLPAGQQP